MKEAMNKRKERDHSAKCTKLENIKDFKFQSY